MMEAAVCSGQNSRLSDTTYFKFWILRRHHHKWIDTVIIHPNASQPNTLCVRGKALPILFFATGINFSLGVEYGFRKAHAIGLDAGYTYFSTPHEEYDSVSASYKSAARVGRTIRGVMLSYRNYWRMRTWNGNPRRAYGSVFLRFGDEDASPEKGYNGNIIAYRKLEKSIGILYGMLLPYTINGFCADISIGPFWKWKDIHDVERNTQGVQITTDERTDNFGVRFGLSLAFVGKRQKL